MFCFIVLYCIVLYWNRLLPYSHQHILANLLATIHTEFYLLYRATVCRIFIVAIYFIKHVILHSESFKRECM